MQYQLPLWIVELSAREELHQEVCREVPLDKIRRLQLTKVEDERRRGHLVTRSQISVKEKSLRYNHGPEETREGSE